MKYQNVFLSIITEQCEQNLCSNEISMKYGMSTTSSSNNEMFIIFLLVIYTT